MFDFRVRNLVAAYVAFSVPSQGLHVCSPNLRLMAAIRHVNVQLLYPFGSRENSLRPPELFRNLHKKCPATNGHLAS
jgi:hypothetical protein